MMFNGLFANEDECKQEDYLYNLKQLLKYACKVNSFFIRISIDISIWSIFYSPQKNDETIL